MSRSEEELLQEIFDCMFESLPDSWRCAHMRITTKEEGMEATFRYFQEDSDENTAFQPANLRGAMNAAAELQIRMLARGMPWATALIEVYPDGKLFVRA